MACSKQAGPAAYLKFIEAETGEHVTQQDWHDIRKLADLDGYDISRRRVDSAKAEGVADDLYRTFAKDHPVSGEGFIAMNDELARANNTEATLSIVSYLAQHGVKDTLAQVRADRRAAKEGTPCPMCGGTSHCVACGECFTQCQCDLDATPNYEASYADRVAAYEAMGVSTSDAQGMVDTEDYLLAHENDAEASLADADREYAERVRALEDELGVSTSDAQGMVDAEDVIREKAKQGPYGEARVGSKFRGYRDAASISSDVRSDLKKAVKDGSLPADVKASVRSDKYAGGQAVNVKLTGWEPERVWHRDTDGFGMENWTYTPEAKAVADRVEALRESYNRDASDSQQDYFDVTYYGGTSWDVPAPR